MFKGDCIEKYILEQYGSFRAFRKQSGMKKKTLDLLLCDHESDDAYQKAYQEFLDFTKVNEEELFSVCDAYKGKKLYPDVYDMVVNRLVKNGRISSSVTRREKAVFYAKKYAHEEDESMFEETWYTDSYGTIADYEDLTDEVIQEVIESAETRREYILDAKRAKRTRGEKGWCFGDVADFDDWFFRTVPDMLEEMSRHDSHPLLDENGMHMNVFLAKDEDAEIYSQRWKDILNQMVIFAREAYEPTSSVKDLPDSKEKDEYLSYCFDSFFILFQKYFWDLWI